MLATILYIWAAMFAAFLLTLALADIAHWFIEGHHLWSCTVELHRRG